MSLFEKYIGNLFLSTRFFVTAGVCVAIFIIAFFIPAIFSISKIVFAVFCIFFLIDFVLLFFTAYPLDASRVHAERMSNGDANKIEVTLRNPYAFTTQVTLLDELPVQMQERDFKIEKNLESRQRSRFSYSLRPVTRGEYQFGRLHFFFRSQLGLVVRRLSTEDEDQEDVRVYPSFQNLRNLQLQSHNTIIEGGGSRRVRKIGQSMEFEQIKDYISGDDMRTINWVATARRGNLMVNHYVDEKSQQAYILIDKGRLMKMPFDSMSLLDYAINSALALTNVCLLKQDKVGLITFSNKMGTIIPADRQPRQKDIIMQALYKEQTNFLESDFETLYLQIRMKLKQRSLLLLYTNFESLEGLGRQMSYLRMLAKYHLLVVVFFENTALTALSQAEVFNIEDIYVKTVADKMVTEKKLIVRELKKHGILSILSSPQNLTVNSINKYLEIKAKQAV